MLTRAEKQEVLTDLRSNIEKSKAIVLTNLIGISSNDAVAIRKKVRDANGKIVVAKNTFFRKASEGTPCAALFADLKGEHAVAFAFSDVAEVAKIIAECGPEMEKVVLKGGFVEGRQVSAKEMQTLASLPARPQMLATLLATFNAPVSAFVRVLDAIREQKDKSAA